MSPSSVASDPARVSVVMPLYNAARYVGEALESIRTQSRPVQEVIVVDDGSTDGSAEIAGAFPFVTLVRKEHTGINETLNRGLGCASGNFLAFLDADDRWLPEKIQMQMATLQADPSLDMVFGHSRRFRSADREGRRIEAVVDVLPGMSKTSMLIRRASFDKAGWFPENTGGHDFLNWYSLATEAELKHKMLSDIVVERRIHDANFGLVNRDKQRKTYFVSLKATLDRRRAAQIKPSMKSEG